MNSSMNGTMVLLILLFYFFYAFSNYGIIPLWLSLLLTAIFGFMFSLNNKIKDTHAKEWVDSMEPDKADIEELDSRFKDLW